MLKKFFNEHGFTILTTVSLVVIFALGFVFGRYAKAAPSLVVIEQEQCKQETPLIILELDAITEEADEVITAEVTAYCPCQKCCGVWATKRPTDENGNAIVYTASGTVAKAGRTIAVDPNVIPYGTEVMINGHIYVAEDSGGLIKGQKIDIYFDSHEEAREFGVQQLKATIINKE